MKFGNAQTTNFENTCTQLNCTLLVVLNTHMGSLICGLFNDASIISHYIKSNDVMMVNNELERG
jgi:hypothetical protein